MQMIIDVDMDAVKDPGLLRISQIRKVMRLGKKVVPVDGVGAVYSYGTVVDADGKVISKQLYAVIEE